MMPCFGLHSRALHLAADTIDVTEQSLLDYDHHDQYHERVRRRRVMRQENFAHTLNSETRSSRQDPSANNHSGNRLRFPVAIGMGSIRRPRRKFQPAPDNKRTRDVEPRLNAVRYKHVSMAEESTENFRGRENRIHDHPEERNPRTSFQGSGTHRA